MSAAISVQSISKRYGGTEVLRSVSFECPQGSIVAFVGPNGAGKSTTMRIICRLTHPSSGRVIINGRSLNEVEHPGVVIGSVLDPAAHHPGRTVLRTVAIPAAMLGVPRTRVDEVIAQIGLASVKRRRFKALSLGMKQRVSLAIALLAKPEILVLDEPMNGLDVDGIEWIRTLLRRFADDGGTVLVSSHLLNELQMFADRLVIISQGQVKADQALVKNSSLHAHVSPASTADFERLMRLHDIAFVEQNGSYVVEASNERVASLALDAGVLLLEITATASRVSIERSYHNLTTGDFTMGDEK